MPTEENNRIGFKMLPTALYMTTVVIIVNGCGLGIGMHCKH